MLLHHYAWWFTYGDGLQYGRYYRAGEGQLQVFANVSAGEAGSWQWGPVRMCQLQCVHAMPPTWCLPAVQLALWLSAVKVPACLTGPSHLLPGLAVL